MILNRSPKAIPLLFIIHFSIFIIHWQAQSAQQTAICWFGRMWASAPTGVGDGGTARRLFPTNSPRLADARHPPQNEGGKGVGT